MSIKSQRPEDRIKYLTHTLNQWAHEYYTLDAPSVPDSQYDESLKELQELEDSHPHLKLEHSPTSRVGSKLKNELEKVEHISPMLSLSNAFNLEDIQAFFKKASRHLKLEKDFFECTVEEKIDGLAMSIHYKDGFFDYACTRGNGKVGEKVSNNVKTIKDIPLMLQGLPKGKTEVRGEVYMDLNGFEELNEKLKKDNKKVFANPRNAASGSVRLLDSTITATRPLKFFAYQIVNSQLNQNEVMSELKNLGFSVNPNYKLCKTQDSLTKVVQKYINNRSHSKQNYDIDGLVIKINSNETQKSLGFVTNSPRWATAYKLPAIEKLTVIEKIETQIGRTGAITPVAHLTPVDIGGVIVQRATLHNLEQVQKKDVRVGDTVWVRRAGDVIPEIIQVDLSQRPKNSKSFEMPKNCHVCNGKIELFKSIHKCTNSENCSAQIKEQIKHFVGRKTMDIRGLGDQWIESFYELGFIKKRSDVFLLTEKKEQIEQLEGYGEKSFNNLKASLEKAKSQNASKFLFSLGIDLIGLRTAEELLEFSGSMEKLFSLSIDQLNEIPNIGPETAKVFFEEVNKGSFKKEMSAFKKIGLNAFTEVLTKSSETTSGPLAGLSFVITGTLSKSRDEIKEEITKLGAKVMSGLSKKTDYLLAGEKAGSKLAKAEKLGVKVINEEDLKAIVTQDSQ